MFRSRLTLAVALLAFAATTRPVDAQGTQSCNAGSTTGTASCSLSTTVRAKVPSLVQLSLVQPSSTSSTFGDSTFLNDADAASMGGYKASDGPTLTVKANRSWTLNIAAGAANWNKDGAASTKPAGELEYNVDAGTFAPMASGAGSDIFSSGGATPTSATPNTGQSVVIGYRVKYNWDTDAPGTYTLPVVFTLSAP